MNVTSELSSPTIDGSAMVLVGKGNMVGALHCIYLLLSGGNAEASHTCFQFQHHIHLHIYTLR